MPTEPLATLSTDGYVRDPAVISARLLNYFFRSDYSQTNAYRNGISSLPYIIAQSPNNIQDIKDGIENSLNRMFSAHFDQVSIGINHNMITDPSTGKETGRVNISVSIGFLHNGQPKQVARLISVLGQEFTVSDAK